MNRAMGLTAVLLTLMLSVGLALRLRHERYAGLVSSTTSTELEIDVLERLEDEGDMDYPPPPATLKGSLRGWKYGKDFLLITVPAPVPVLQHATKNAAAEVKHAYLDLPMLGPVIGVTTYSVGSFEWRESRVPLYCLMGGIGLAPLLLWGLAVLIAAVAGASGVHRSIS
jgi:hypothetical protein